MGERPSYGDGHLVVAAVRILEHRLRHPPGEKEIAEILAWHEDRTRVIVRELAEMGCLQTLRNAFDVRFQVGDATLLEGLEAAEDVSATFAREIEAFDERSRADAERLERMFGETRRKLEDKAKTGLEDDFESFRKRKPANPFGDD